MLTSVCIARGGQGGQASLFMFCLSVSGEKRAAISVADKGWSKKGWSGKSWGGKYVGCPELPNKGLN